MVTHYKTRGLVFKKEDRLEADRIFSVFTQDFGRIEIFAKAIRRIASKLRGGIEIFSLSEIEFIQGKNRKTQTDAIFIEKSKHIVENPEKIEIAQKVCDLLNVFIKGQERDEKMWDIAADFFQKLRNAPPALMHSQLLYPYFFWNFISVLGYAPELSKCARCEQALSPHSLYFSCKEGGVICGNCHNTTKDGFKITSDTIKILRIMLKNPPAGGWEILLKLRVETNLQKELQEVSESYYRYLLSTHSFGHYTI